MRLADQVDFVIGVDTHKQSHTLGIVDNGGRELDNVTIPTDAFGYRRMLTWASKHASEQARRVWAIEGTGSFGAGLVTYLLSQGEWVVEIDRPARPARRNGAKSDTLDAYRAAREALARTHLAQPRRRGEREAIRVLLTTRDGAIRARAKALCHLHALIVNAPAQLRDQLRKDNIDIQVSTIALSRRAVIRFSRSWFGDVLVDAGLLCRLGSFVGSVAAAVHVDVVGGVDESVEHGLGDDRVGEQRIPVFGSTVGGEHQRPAGTFGDEFVEVVGLGGGEVPHREVIEDQHRGVGPAVEAGRPGSVGVTAGEVSEEPAGFGEGDGVAVAAGVVADCLSDEGLADSDGSVEDD